MGTLSPIGKRGLKAIVVNGFFRPYYFLRTSWPVWFYALNLPGRRLYRQNFSPLTEVQKRLIRDLNEKGIGMADLKELLPEGSLLGRLHDYAKSLLPQAKLSEGKPFLKMLWDQNNAVLDFRNPFVRLALDDKILGVVNGYLEMCAKFFYFSLNVTMPITAGSPPLKSQRWHRDPEDIKICKVFLYLSDVDESSGPFTYVTKSHYGGVWNKFFHPRIPQRVRPSAEEIEKLVPREDIKVCTGRAGTIIFCDTRGLHKGGYATLKERLMFTAEYSPATSVVPIRYTYPEDFAQEYGRLSPTAQFAVSRVRGVIRALNWVYEFQRRYFRY